MNDGKMIIIVFAALILIPSGIVFVVLMLSKRSRKRKIDTYTGVVMGEVLEIKDRGLECPWIICVGYRVNGVDYKIKETAKLKAKAIKVGPVPVGQKKSFVLGEIKAGSVVEIHYDEKNPEKGIIYGNEGLMTS